MPLPIPICRAVITLVGSKMLQVLLLLHLIQAIIAMVQNQVIPDPILIVLAQMYLYQVVVIILRGLLILVLNNIII